MLIRLEFRNKFIAAGDSPTAWLGTGGHGQTGNRWKQRWDVCGVSQVRIFYVDFIAIFLPPAGRDVVKVNF